MKPNRQILEEAAEWFVEFSAGDGDPATRRKFDAWMRQSPQHVRAYLELMPVWEDAALPAVQPDPGPEALIARARSAADVTPIGERARPVAPASVARGSRLKYIALAASILIAAGGLFAWQQAGQQSYRTETGEQRSLTLADGSTIELNSRSRIKIRFTAQNRAIDLLEGQALFRVTHDPSRPFVVHSGDAHVRAVGTQFDVYRKKSGTVVTVVEGRVIVAPDASAVQYPLGAGEQLAVTAKTRLHPTQADPSTAIAWTQRRLVFDLAPLTEVAEEFNRYNSRQLVLEGGSGEFGSFHLNGVFSSTDPASLVRFLRDQPGLTVTEASGEIRVARAHD